MTQVYPYCRKCRKVWQESMGSEARMAAAVRCPRCDSPPSRTNALTCGECKTRLRRPSPDGLCGLCTPVGAAA